MYIEKLKILVIEILSNTCKCQLMNSNIELEGKRDINNTYPVLLL